jgi:hypothetical protein
MSEFGYLHAELTEWRIHQMSFSAESTELILCTNIELKLNQLKNVN